MTGTEAADGENILPPRSTKLFLLVVGKVYWRGGGGGGGGR